MPVLEWDPGASPEAPGTLYFYEQGRDPSTGWQVTSSGVQQGATSSAYTGAAADTDVITTRVTGDSAARLVVDADGTLRWASGSAVPDVSLGRSGAGILAVTGGLSVSAALALAGAATTTRAAASDVVHGSLVTNDTFDRWRVQAGGAQEWGPGNGARDVGLSRGAANRLDVTTADLRLGTAGRGLQVTEGGAGAKMGTATLVAGTVTVNTTAVTANSRIFLTAQTSGAAPGALRISARSAGTSFAITSTSGTDTSAVAWFIIEPAT